MRRLHAGMAPSCDMVRIGIGLGRLGIGGVACVPFSGGRLSRVAGSSSRLAGVLRGAGISHAGHMLMLRQRGRGTAASASALTVGREQFVFTMTSP